MSELRIDRPIAAFAGRVRCTREAGALPGLTLRGAAADDPREQLILSFICTEGTDPPATLDAPRVVALDAQRYRIESVRREWLIRARALHVHRDVRAAFFRAVPPRRAPPGKRLFWRVALRLARAPAGVRLLRALRGR